MATILAFGGSLRKESFNQRLAVLAAAEARAVGATAETIALRDYPLPVFDEDLEKAHGQPAQAAALKAKLKAAQGWIIAAPEYNSSITAALKNALDWVSRVTPGERPLEVFAGKVVLLLAASPGGLGGLRGLVTVRSILGNIGVIVLPEQLAIAKAHEAFTAEGALQEAKQAEQLRLSLIHI